MILNTLLCLFLRFRIKMLEHDIAEWAKISSQQGSVTRKVIRVEQLAREADLIVLKARLSILTN